MTTPHKKAALAALVGTLLTGAAFGGGWTLFDEQEDSTEAVLTSCNALGVCTTPLNFNGDLNSNPVPQPVVDLAIGNDHGPVRLYIGTGEDGRGFTSSFNISESGLPFRTSGLRFADMDNDGDLEMLRTTRGNGNHIYRFRYGGPPFYCDPAASPGGCLDVHQEISADTDNSQGLAVGDLDLDGKIDIFVVNGVATSGDQRNKVYLNTTPNPTQTSAMSFGPAIPLGLVGEDVDSRKVELVDVDGDTDLDAIVANADANDNWLYVNQTLPVTMPPAAALFAAAIPLTAALGDDAESSWGLAVGDLDNDGKTDIVVANKGASNRYYINAGIGAGRFAATGTFGDPSDQSTAVKLGDVNRDGFLDAVVTNDPGPNRVHLLQGSAFVDYTLVNPTGLPGAQPFNLSSARALDLGKLDNDGWLDIVVANYDGQYNLRFLNNATCFQSNGQPLNCEPFSNRLPAISGPAGTTPTTNEDTPLAITVASVTATDLDNLAADLRLAIEPGTNYTVTTASGPAPTITPAENYSGPLVVNVRVTDLTSLSTPFALNATVTAVPDAPTFTSTAVTAVVQGMPYSYSVTTADLDVGEARTITAPTKPTWLTLADNGNGTATLSGTPAAADIGAHNVTLEVRDAANLVASQPFTVTVADANDGPVFTSTAVTSATAGTAYSYAITTSDPDVGDTRTISAPTKPAWLTLADGGNGTATLSGTPAAADIGAHNVTLEVRDAASVVASQSFTVTVVDANDAPAFTSTAAASATAGTAYSYAIATSDPDAGDTRTITAPTKPTWLTLVASGNGTATLAGTPAAANVGSHSVSLLVTDAAGATATQTFTITVANAPPAPAAPSGGGGGGGSTGLIEVLALLAGLGAALRRRRLAP